MLFRTLSALMSSIRFFSPEVHCEATTLPARREDEAAGKKNEEAKNWKKNCEGSINNDTNTTNTKK